MPHAVARTDPGLQRERNEDAVGLDLEAGVYALADGLGGHPAGEVASTLAVATAVTHVAAHLKPDGAPLQVLGTLARGVAAANRRVHRQGRRAAYRGMGATLLVAVVRKGAYALAHVGDSRAYRIDGSEIHRLTRDHSPEEEPGRTPGGPDPLSGAAQGILRSVGPRPRVEVDLYRGPLWAGDLLLLCSDGLTRRVREEEIAGIVRADPPERAADQLIARARERGGPDNISVILIAGDSATPTAREEITCLREGDPERITDLRNRVARWGECRREGRPGPQRSRPAWEEIR